MTLVELDMLNVIRKLVISPRYLKTQQTKVQKMKSEHRAMTDNSDE